MLKKEIKELKEKIDKGEFEIVETTKKFRKVKIKLSTQTLFNIIDLKGDPKDILKVKVSGLVADEDMKNKVSVKNGLIVIDKIRKSIKRGNYFENYDLKSRSMTLDLRTKKGLKTITLFIKDFPNVEKEKARFRKDLYITFINSRELDLLKLEGEKADNPDELLTDFFNEFIVKEVEFKK